MVASREPDASAILALYALRSRRPPVPLCAYCTPRFSRDGKSMYLFSTRARRDVDGYVVSTSAIFAAAKSPEGADITKLPGAKPLHNMDALLGPGPDAETFAFTRSTVRRNLYSIPVR